MAYTYSNTKPTLDIFETLYADSEKFLLKETLTSDVMGERPCKDWLLEQLEELPFHSQFFKDGKTICWFAGEQIDGLAKYSIALVSPDENGSRAYWYDVDFWNTVKASHKTAQLNGWFADTLRGTSLHSTLTASFEGKPHTQETFTTLSNVEVVTVTMTYGEQQ